MIDIRPDHWRIVEAILKKHVPRHMVWAFGSRAKWSAKAYSDLDLAIITEKALPLAVSASLSDDFSESDLPYKVDVVDWATTSAAFREIIERDRVVVWEGRSSTKGAAGEWGEIPFSEAVLLNPATPLVKGVIYPFVEMSAIAVGTRDVKCSEYRNFSGGGSRFQDRDTLMARITPCLENGKLARFQAPEGEPIGHGSTEFIVIRGKPNVTDNDYAYYLAISSEVRKFAISQMTGTSGRQRVPTDALGKISVLLPPLTEQKAIAHILGTLDDKIALNRRMNATLEAIAQVLFKSWFVDFDPVRAKMEGRWQRDQSLPGLPADLYDLFPERLVASELGEIPEGWAIGSFSEAVEIIGGGTPKTSVSEYWGGDIPWFSVVDTPPSSDVFVVQTEKSITRSGLNGSSARMIAKGTTIISARGTVGNLGIAGRDMTFNQSCYALRGKNGSGDYFVFLSAQCMVEQLKVMAHGSVFSTITRQTFDAVRFVLPPEPVLQQFERTATSVFDAIFGNGNDSRSLARLRGTLLPKLISGELRIQDAERIVGAAV
ncbi:restriction endonuclease subunit S [Verminephrobacter eiseniae]|uniref:restriction endonuclease subunit S n=1 Tax=Verminephrobacter eiseniae TaxID=364317 RepID=UPI0002E389A6|nr:restriction endonuclease subunit S [Verminephrobacter eiseniae]